MSAPDIVVRGVSKRYRRSRAMALNGIDLEVGNGEFFGLLGPNGAGKTTLISILTGVVRPTEGQVRIRGLDLLQDRDRIHQVIGAVPQEIALYEVLSAWENLLLFGQLLGMGKQQVRDRGAKLLARVGLLDRANETVQHWSGGMKRRLNLIVGLIHGPDVLFLDEPTVGIDVQSRTAIWELLTEVNKQGTTMVYTSHHLEEAERLCDRVVIIDKGTIVGEVKDTARSDGHERLEEIFLRITGKALRDTP
ncbi:MAG: ABC transporter ATP-binding protein [Flavobacteriales bacterium]|nr:ABC transporter ATP-binding protein [Flavobacteriales bacterium]